MREPEIVLDHVGLAVRDLDAAAKTYEALGFRLTPLARQSGPERPGAATTQWGAANRCIMLRQGYVELLGLVDPSLYDNQIKSFLARHEGVHILALGVADAAAQAERLVAAGFAGIALRPLERPVATPKGERSVRFQRVPLPPDSAPEGRVQLVQHLTPELMWQPHLLDQPNRAIALTEVVLATQDPDETAGRHARFSGVAPRREGTAHAIDLPRGRVVIVAAGTNEPSPPAFTGFTIATDDRNRALRGILDLAAIPHGLDGEDVLIGPAEAAGAAVRFAAA